MKYHMKHCLKYFLLTIALLVMTVSGSSISKAESILPEEANQQHQFISAVEAHQQYQSISPQDAKAELDSDASIILLDVRNPHEHDASHIPNSILVPYLLHSSFSLLRYLPSISSTLILYLSSNNSTISSSPFLSNTILFISTSTFSKPQDFMCSSLTLVI